MKRRRNPYGNAEAKSLIKMLKFGAVNLMASESFKDLRDDLPRFIETHTTPVDCTLR